MVQEQSGATIREQRTASDATQLERLGNSTIRESSSQPKQTHTAQQGTSLFHGYRIIKQMPSTSTEADIFIIEKEGIKYVLKLYRFGIEPKRDILQAIKMLGEKYPGEFIHVYETDYDSERKRWYEIQEYAKSGSLQNVLSRSSKFTPEQRNWLFTRVTYEVGKALNILHKNNILHLDMKPSNILVRSMKPFDLVLIDFGIASTLQSDLSKKFTQARGTPMYQSPESWVGSMGRASDWWGLGMILLEIATGKHPFQGLNAQVIASTIATRPVEIPATIDTGQRELLRGLLTRDPDNRWRCEQIVRWLKGERGIGDKFEDAAVQHQNEAEKSSAKPLTFMGKTCTSLEEFSREVVQSEDTWDKGKVFLMRGYLRQWLEENGDFDTSIEIDNMLGEISDVDEKLFCMVRKFGKDIPFVFCGHLITFKNLFMIAAKELQRQPLTSLERKIAASIDDETITRLIDGLDSATPELEALALALKKLAGKSSECKTGFLEFYTFPEKYYCPFVSNASDIKSLVQQTSGLDEAPLKLSEWHYIENNYFIPPYIVATTEEALCYASAIKELLSRNKNGMLLPRTPSTKGEAERIEKKLLPHIKREHHTLEFIDVYIRSKDYYCPFAGSLDECEKLKAPPEFMSEWERLINSYILPFELVRKTNSAETYHEAMKQIMGMEAEGQLIVASADKKIRARAEKCSTLEEYIALCHEAKGYTATIDRRIDDAMKKFSDVRYFKVDASSIHRDSEVKLWREYLKSLSKHEITLIDEDMKLLKKANKDKTDALVDRLSHLGATVHELSLRQRFMPLIEHYMQTKAYAERST